MKLNDKVSIVTGSGSGIGRSIALKFASAGAKVVVSDINEDGGTETLDKIIKSGGQASFFKSDISKADQVENLVKATVDEYGGVDILVNNAGIVDETPTLEVSEEIFEKVINVNLKGSFLTAKKVLPHMLKKGKGKIVNIASIAGLVGFEGLAPYCASKGGIIAMSKALASEYASKGININIIAPGIIKTDMTKEMLNNEEVKKGMEASTPYIRLGEPEDIANGALYLASDQSDFVNGEVLAIDGGWTSK
jgi:NAD(P)-dependent dehydrogenase (short-subunit alcohol dehydrogenase family)